MLNWEFFYFLWDDPLFAEPTTDPQREVCDSEFIKLRREMRLLALEALYRKVEMLQHDLNREKQFLREAEAREVWTINEFLNLASPDDAERILINRKVNNMDPDFSFAAALTK